ncbi:MAG TPA: hypothetical protein VGT40_10920 [Methylomirabilota bacterium]|jgi:hypothetical protein|nr:hypothetical protein [Methylomirabilota bacterium]
MSPNDRAAQVDVVETLDAIEECYRRGWTDGLPVMPPTTDRVEAMLAAAALPPDHVLGEVSVRRRAVTAERAAANAVMAGCLPEHFPVVMAALAAFFEHDGNILHEISAATNAPGWLILVNGPLRRAIGLGCTDNLLSSANRANATIGRAVRLVLMNVLESRPGILDRGCMGSLCKVGVCFGEDEERSPWPAFHTTRGLGPEDSAVTVASIQDPEMVGNRYGLSAESVMDSVADTMLSHGLGVHFTFTRSQWLWIVGHWHAEMLARQGWDRPRMQRYVWERAWRTRAEMKRLGYLRGEVAPGDESGRVLAAASPEDIFIVKAGGDSGIYSTLIKIYVGMPATTVRVGGGATAGRTST